MANSEERLRSILATLEQCRAGLIASADRETAQLVSVAILELRMKLNRVAHSELKALCDAMLPDDAPAGRIAKYESAASPAPASPAEAGQIVAAVFPQHFPAAVPDPAVVMPHW